MLPQWIALVLVLCGLALETSSAQAQGEPASLAEMAHASQRNKANQPASSPETKALVDQFNAEHQDSGGDPQSPVDVQQLLSQHSYDELDKAAERARSHRSRASGGIWQLYLFYDAIGKAANEDPQLMSELKRWADARPQSVTARVALAQAYLHKGFQARGSGFADTVTDSGWTALSNGADSAAAWLQKASQIGNDPHINYLWMGIAGAQGWDRQRTRQLFEHALSEEPGYYHTFRQYANYLLPKWYGEDGQAEALAEELQQRVGGNEGLFLYFEVATVIGCDCGGSDPKLQRMSWDKIRDGFAALQQLYGANNRDNNRFAFLAYAHGDKPAAQAVFAKISDSDDTVWRSRSAYDTARAWALMP